MKLEILTLNEIKTKVLKGFYYHQEITKTKAQEITPSEKYDQKKRDIFPKNRSTSENFEIIVIATEGNNRNVRIIKQGDNEVHIIPETELQSKRRS